ncbi:MAG: GTP pyrophosphokinase [Bacteroidia bacterium]|nr:GTP pyrophosphokinase [Bacteroidia bacterium]
MKITKENKEKKNVTLTENSVEKNALLPKGEFLKKFKINLRLFESTKIKWIKLQEIHKDYIDSQSLLEGIARDVASKFLTNDAKEAGVHSVRYRLKKPDSLIEKIIRKTLDRIKRGKKKAITAANYTEEINDLIGIRILHVFKDDWFSIHNYILNQCQYQTKEKPVAYYRKGDQKDFIDECKKNGCEAKVHPKAYRSIHYIINPHPKKNIAYVEIQVRTVFEDGWSEIDHKLRYVSKKGTKHVLDSYLLALNRIAGSADEIGSIIKNRQTELRQEESEKELFSKKRKQ